MYDHTLHCRRIFICCYSLQVFSTVDCFKINAKQMIQMPKSKNMLESKIIKGNGKRNLDESYTNK